MILGKKTNGEILKINLDRLVESRAIVQANSGGGKSWAIRRILEQTHGKIQQIVIDIEDEFATLREKFDYILAGSSGGDCPADVRSAPLLATRLLELNVSAIVGIYDLKQHDRIRFVRLFLDSLVNAPRHLWHPVLVIIDEAHIFCPQQGEAESAAAVIDLMTRGRKRGFCGILATQRISKLHKDAAAEANNKLIGRSALDVDMKRAADELGFSNRAQQLSLRILKPGQFYVFGPAMSNEVTEIKVGEIETTHPKAGMRAILPLPPRGTILAALGKLKDLPKVAEEEMRTVVSLTEKIRGLELQLRKSPTAQTVDHGKDNHGICFNSYRLGQSKIENKNIPKITTAVKEKTVVEFPQDSRGLVMVTALTKAERLILTALSQYSQGRSKIQIAVLTGYAHRGGSFCNALSSLRTKGLIIGGSEKLELTESGEVAVGPTDPLPTGRDLFEKWCRDVGKPEREILTVLSEVYPSAISKTDIAERTESHYEANGGSFNNAISRLRTLELIKGKKEIVLSEELIG